MSNTFYASGTAGTTGREPFEDSYGIHTNKSAPVPVSSEVPGGTYDSGIGKSDVTKVGYGRGPPDVTTGAAGAGLVGAGTGLVSDDLNNAALGVNPAGGLGTAGVVDNTVPRAYVASAHQRDTTLSGVDRELIGAGTVGAGAGAVAATGAGSDLDTTDTRQPTTHYDRVGSLNQGGAMFERTTDSGPQTTGAAGTDRFDSDRVRPGQSGNTYGNRYEDDAGLSGEPGAPYSQQTKGQEAAASALHTSDKEFTHRINGSIMDAYHDTHGRFKGNTSGPGGYSALTGREGTLADNPVYQAKTRDAEAAAKAGGQDTTGAGASDVADDGDDVEGGKKKGFVQKIKDIL